jgi:hypothetical protein
MRDLIGNPQFLITVGILFAAFALVGFLIWQEKRPRQRLMPGLIPTTPIFLLTGIVILLTVVHLMHVVAPGSFTATPN